MNNLRFVDFKSISNMEPYHSSVTSSIVLPTPYVICKTVYGVQNTESVWYFGKKKTFLFSPLFVIYLVI